MIGIHGRPQHTERDFARFDNIFDQLQEQNPLYEHDNENARELGLYAAAWKHVEATKSASIARWEARAISRVANAATSSTKGARL
jgi:hypothetical protein